jgi:hypothetical protein
MNYDNIQGLVDMGTGLSNSLSIANQINSKRFAEVWKRLDKLEKMVEKHRKRIYRLERRLAR